MPIIHYKFADGHTETIEVTDEVATAFEQLKKYEKKVERKETRRHVSLNVLLENGFDFPTESIDILNTLDKQEQEKSEWEKEKFRRHNLTYRQADAYFRHKYLHIKKTEIARYMNVTEGAVRKLIKKAEATLREYRLANEKEIKLLEAIFGSCL